MSGARYKWSLEQVAERQASSRLSMETQLKKKPVQAYYDAITRELAKHRRMNKLKRLANEGGVSMDNLC